MKWIVLLLIVVGVYFAVEHWSPRWDGFTSLNPQPASAPGSSPRSPIDLLPSGIFGGWSVQTLGGLSVDLPVRLQYFAPPQSVKIPANVRVEGFQGKSSSTLIVLVHATNTSMAGSLNLSGSEKGLAVMAQKLQLEVMSTNSGTTLVNGMRVRRSDYVGRSGNPRMRDRCLLYERANNLWLLELITPETDQSAEQEFQRIAYSARPI